MMIYADENGLTPLSRLRQSAQAEALIARAGIGADRMNGYAVLTDEGQSLLMTWAQVDGLPVVFCEWRPVGTLDGKMSRYYTGVFVRVCTRKPCADGPGFFACMRSAGRPGPGYRRFPAEDCFVRASA